MYETPEHHPAFEEYCEAIFELAEDDIEVLQARIAERLDVSRPAVSEMVKRLRSEGLVRAGTPIELSPAGMTLASRVVRHHRIAERFMTDVLGLPYTTAHHEAGKWEHVMSADVATAMIRVLGDPTTCPHGNPIPGTDYEAPDAVPLATLRTDDVFVVSRIPESLESTAGVLAHLESAGLLPGQRGRVLAVAPDGTMTIDAEGMPIGLGAPTTEQLMVTMPNGN